jgi:hypothetical protein
MRLNLLPWLLTSALLFACVDDGVIGNQTTEIGGNHGSSTTTAGQSSVATGGSTSTTTGGHTSTATGGSNQAGATATTPEQLLFDATTARCGITTTSAPASNTLPVPLDPYNAQPAAMWQPLVDACRNGGWDLTRCSGSDLLVMSATTNQTETMPALDISVNIFMRGTEVCCVTRTANAPGVPMATPCPESNMASQALSTCGIAATTPASEIQLEIPASLTGPNWAIKAEACTDGKWDLAACAGSTATFTSFDLGKTGASGNALTAWVVTQNDRVCCIYESEDYVTPGILPVSCH